MFYKGILLWHKNKHKTTKRGVNKMKKASLRIVINYQGTKFFTKNEDGTFTEHETLEEARDYLIYMHGVDVDIKIETEVRFSN